MTDYDIFGQSWRFGQAHRTNARCSAKSCVLGWNYIFYWWANWAARKCHSTLSKHVRAHASPICTFLQILKLQVTNSQSLFKLSWAASAKRCKCKAAKMTPKFGRIVTVAEPNIWPNSSAKRRVISTGHHIKVGSFNHLRDVKGPILNWPC